MDWARAIERNSEALGAIVALLIAMVGDLAERVPLAMRRAVTRMLVPTESAVRRLIVIAARGVAAGPPRRRAMTKVPVRNSVKDRVTFQLFDRRKSFGPPRGEPKQRFEPRVHVIGGDPRIAMFRPGPEPQAGPPAPLDDGLVSTRRLRLRLDAVALALRDLPRQAKRLVRWRARRDNVPELKFRSPLRPGPPPGNRRRAVHDIDFVLRECHALAFDALKLDTS